jgi:serine/threonine protein kinase
VAERRTIAIGDLLEGKYQVTGELGAGAMGVVYAGRHLTLARPVAIKTLHPEIAEHGELVGRFEQEARAASAIGHPNIVEVYDLGTAGETRFMVMERLEGRNLAELLEAEGRLAPERAAAIVVQVLSALGAAHKRGIVHRDLKPENIFITSTDDQPEFVKLLDFGISKVLEAADPSIAGAGAESRATRYGVVLGTPLYMSPEQARGQTDIDHRADLWAVGCVLYEALCGQPPFDGDNYNQILGAILEGRFAPPRERAPALPAGVEQVILKALAHDRERRPGSAAAMRAELSSALGMPATATPLPTAAPVAAYETALSSALDRLESRASAQVDLPATPLDLAIPDVGAAEPGPAAAGADAFAPPPEADKAALAPAITVRRPEPRPAALVESGPAPSPRRVGRAPARRGPDLRSALTVLAGMALIAAGVLAVYRYATLGYVLSAPEATTTPVDITVIPAGAEIRVDGAPLTVRPIEARIGVEHIIEVRARQRLTVRRAITASRGGAGDLAVRLPTALAPLGPGAAAAITEVQEPAPFADIDAALERIAAWSACPAELRAPLAEGERAYRAAAARGPSAKAPPAVAELPAAAVSECRLRLDQQAAGELDGAGARYLAAVDALDALTQRLATYYRKEEYRDDHLAFGKKKHPELLAAYQRAGQAQEALERALELARSRWQARELAALGQHGDDLHRQLRRALLVSRAWAAQPTSDPAAAHAALDRALAAEVGAGAPEGAGRVLDALRALRTADADSAGRLYDAAARAFNRMIL